MLTRSMTKTLISISIFMLSTLNSYSNEHSRWDKIGILNEGRQQHTATLLASGSVLVAGGKREDLGLAQTEIYNPKTGIWTQASPLSLPRESHTATRLLDGRVLVVGGESFSQGLGLLVTLRSTEIFDAATGTWSSAGNLHESRADHSATLLKSGKVLVVGGSSAFAGAKASAEIYDPETNTWDPVDSLTEARFDHTASLLPSGDVLVVGGTNLLEMQESAEIYNPRIKRWTPADTIDFPRANHTASSFANGDILISGGIKVVHTPTGPIPSYPIDCEIFDWSDGIWLPGPPLNIARTKHSAITLPSGKVILVGGQIGEFPLNNSEVYDSDTNKWSFDAPISNHRRNHTATLLPSGQILIAGGEGLIEDGLTATELYTPNSQEWLEATPSVGDRKSVV